MVLVLETRCDRGLARVGLSVYPLASRAGARRSTGRRCSQLARTLPCGWLRRFPLVFTPGGRALPYHMPVALASHFDLRVEVLSSMKDLEKIHIAGHPLVGDPTSKRVDDRHSNPSFYAESWHHVRLRRDSHELALWIDGRKASVAPNAAATSEWLTFEPGPERPTTFRNLIVEW